MAALFRGVQLKVEERVKYVKGTMKIFVFLLVVASLANAADPQVRLLVHSTKQISENWGLAGWVVGNGKQGSNLVVTGGVRYRCCGGDDQQPKFWTEFMFGGIRTGRKTQNFFDTRTNVNLTKRVNVWGETSIFSNQFYWFLESDYSRKWWLVGWETENVHKRGADSLGIGVHVKFRIAKGIWVGPAYQWRRNEPNVLRVYMVIHLPGW